MTICSWAWSEQDGAKVREDDTLKAIWIVALSVLAGFAAVYVTIGRPDNASESERQAAAMPAGPSAASPPAASRGTGQMAAFVRKATPAALPDITFQDGAGTDVTLSSFKGKVILLNLWATWCVPCREEMPALDRLQQALGGEKFEVVALSLDRKGAEASQKFLDEVGAKALKLYIDATSKQGLALKLIGMPTTILINADGMEVGRLAGPAEWDSEEAKRLVQTAMN
jgi:thiol-disulfide isomerase/thioredoxin